MLIALSLVWNLKRSYFEAVSAATFPTAKPLIVCCLKQTTPREDIPTFPLQGRDMNNISWEEIITALLHVPKVLGLARITNSAVMKYGRHVQLCEARNMQFGFEACTNQNSCCNWCMGGRGRSWWQRRNICYIIVEYIDGRSHWWARLARLGRQSSMQYSKSDIRLYISILSPLYQKSEAHW